MSGLFTKDELANRRREVSASRYEFREKKEKSVDNRVFVALFHCGRLHREAVAGPPGLVKQQQKIESVVQVLGDNTHSGTLESDDLKLSKRLSHVSLSCCVCFCLVIGYFMYESADVFIRSTKVSQRCLVFSAFRAWEFLGWDFPGVLKIPNWNLRGSLYLCYIIQISIPSNPIQPTNSCNIQQPNNAPLQPI